MERGELQRVLPPLKHGGASQDIFFSVDGSALFDDAFTQWNVADGVAQKVERFKMENESVETLALSPDNILLAAIDVKGSSAVWGFQSGKRLWFHHFGSDEWGEHMPLAFSPDGKFLAACVINLFEVCEAATGKLVYQKELSPQRTLALAWSSDGSTLVAGSRDGSLRIWNGLTFQLQKTIQVARREINQLTFSPDGSTLAAATDDGKVHLLNVQTGKAVGELSGHAMWVTAVRFSRDGKRLVSGGSDNTIKIWSLSTKKLLVTLQSLPLADRTQVSDQWIAFTPDGFYHGSKGCEKFVRWRVGDKLFSSEKFKARFRRPDLVKAALKE